MAEDWVEELRKLEKWLWPKFEWTCITVGLVGLGLLATHLIVSAFGGESSSSSSGQRYPTAPSKCKCGSCGLILEMTGEYAGKHCPSVPCPSCGSRMWRVK